MAGERPITPGQALLAVKAAGLDPMPRNAKRSADAQLDQLRQAVAAERVKARDLETQLEAARLDVEGAARAVTDAYAEDDAKLAALRRQELQAAEGDVANLGHRVGAAGLRVERAAGA